MSAKVYARALMGAVKKPKPGPVPARTSSTKAVVSTQGVSRFAQVTKLPLTNTAPAPYLHTLGFLPTMELMTAPDFPIPVMGMVHVYNRFTQHAPVPVGATVTLEVGVGRPLARDKGVELDVTVTGRVDGQAAFEDVSTYIAKKTHLPEATEPAPTRRLDVPAGSANVHWYYPAGIGERYARVSGDYNVIHLNSLAAKAFGFPRAIAHGMYTASLAFGQSAMRAEQFQWDVQFAKPILVPGRVDVIVDRGDGEVRVGVVRPKDRAPHVISVITPGVAGA